MCVLSILFGVQTSGHLFLPTVLLFWDNGSYLTLDVFENPVQ